MGHSDASSLHWEPHCREEARSALGDENCTKGNRRATQSPGTSVSTSPPPPWVGAEGVGPSRREGRPT